MSDDVRRVTEKESPSWPYGEILADDPNGDYALLLWEDYEFLKTVCDDWHKQADALLAEVERLKFHCDLLTNELLKHVDKVVLPKFEEARERIDRMRKSGG